MMDKILITGATGFIGSHLVELCVKKGHDVIAFDRYNSNNDWGWLENSDYKNDFELVLGDIRDYDSVFNTIQKCDVVFHLAALIGIPYSYVSPLAYIRTNIEGTYNVLEASKNLMIKEVLITSTSEVYGTAQFVPISESHPLVGQSPYSASKIAADQLSISYFRSFKTPIKIIRPFNTFGPRQSSRAVIPTIISQLIANKESLILGNLKTTRDFTFVQDTCSAMYQLYKDCKLYGIPINIGMNKEISIGDLARKIANLMDINPKIIEDNKRVRPKNSEVERLLCDNSKLKKSIEWIPKYSLDDGLLMTIKDIESNLNKYKTENYNV